MSSAQECQIDEISVQQPGCWIITQELFRGLKYIRYLIHTLLKEYVLIRHILICKRNKQCSILLEGTLSIGLVYRIEQGDFRKNL